MLRIVVNLPAIRSWRMLRRVVCRHAGRGVRVNVSIAPPWAPGRLFLPLISELKPLRRHLTRASSVQQPGMGITRVSVLRLDTGGER